MANHSGRRRPSSASNSAAIRGGKGEQVLDGNVGARHSCGADNGREAAADLSSAFAGDFARRRPSSWDDGGSQRGWTGQLGRRHSLGSTSLSRRRFL